MIGTMSPIGDVKTLINRILIEDDTERKSMRFWYKENVYRVVLENVPGSFFTRMTVHASRDISASKIGGMVHHLNHSTVIHGPAKYIRDDGSKRVYLLPRQSIN